MVGPLSEQALVARATTHGGWFGLVVGATVGFQSGTNLAGVAGGVLGLVAGRVMVRGIAALSWSLLSVQLADQAVDYDESAPA